MESFGGRPAWAVLVLALLAATLLIALNVGWLLAARAMLDGRRRNARHAPGAPPAERAEWTRDTPG
jgi:hypothetical protein